MNSILFSEPKVYKPHTTFLVEIIFNFGDWNNFTDLKNDDTPQKTQIIVSTWL